MKIPKYFIVILSMLLSFSVVAQKIKVKKGKILLDKKVVATLTKNSDKDAIYEYALVSKANVIVLEFNYSTKTFGDTNVFRWLTLKQPTKELINEVDFEFISFTLSMDKAIAEFLAKKLEFLNSDGIDIKRIEAFFSEKRISEKKAKANEAGSDRIAALKKLEEIKPEVTPDFFIVSNEILDRDGNPALLGNVTFSVAPQQSGQSSMLSGDNRVYNFYNIKNQLVASSSSFFQRIEAFNKYYPLAYTDVMHGNSISEANHILNIIFSNAELVVLFPTEEQAILANQVRFQEREENFEEAKSNSSNIYKKPGFVIDKDGTRYDGSIVMLFEEIKNSNDAIARGTSNIGDGGIGSSVTVFYNNDKGKSKRKSIAAKNGTSFCIKDEKGIDICYKAMKSESGPIINSTDGAMALISSKGKFLKEVYKEDQFIIYQYDATKKYYLKIENKEKVFDFDKGFTSKENKLTKLQAYLGGCNYTDGSEYDEVKFHNLGEIKNIINFYNTSCK